MLSGNLGGRWWGKTEPGLLPLTHKRLVLLPAFPRKGLRLRLASAPPGPHRAGGAAVIAPLADGRRGSRWEAQGPVGLGHPGRGGPTRLSWLFLRCFSCRASADLDPPSRPGQDRAARPTLDHVRHAAQPFHILAEGTPHSRPAHPQPPWGRACLCSLRLRGPPQAQPVGGRHIHPPAPWRTEQCQRHTGGVPCAEGKEAGAPSACSAWARGAAREERPEENSTEHPTIHLGGGFPASQGDTPLACLVACSAHRDIGLSPLSSPGGRVPMSLGGALWAARPHSVPQKW